MASDLARVAVYYAPLPDDPLFVASATWLGRDPESGAPAPQPDLSGIAEDYGRARLYGFHATLKPPMRLHNATGWDALHHAAGKAGRLHRAVRSAIVGGERIHGFLALRETEPSPQLQALADVCVAGLDEFRPIRPTRNWRAAAARVVRRAGCDAAALGLSIRIRKLVLPHDADASDFTADERAFYQPAAERHLAGALLEPRRVTDVCLFIQTAPGDPFVIAARLPLRG